MHSHRGPIIALCILAFFAVILGVAYFISNHPVSATASKTATTTKASVSIASFVSVSASQKNQAATTTDSIDIQGPFAYDGTTIWGNDPIEFLWGATYNTIAPEIYLYNSSGAAVLSESANPGFYGGSSHADIKLPSNQNLPTGSYQIAVCDLQTADSSTGKAVCGSSVIFKIVATTTAFTP